MNTTISTTALIHQDGERLFVTSLEISSRFGKRHDNVMQAIKNLECSAEYRLRNFKETVHNRANPSGGQPIGSPMVELTKDGFVLLVMGFTGREAMRWKERYIEAFNQMEARLRGLLDGSASERLLQARVKQLEAEAMALLREKNLRLQKDLSEAKEDAEYQALWRQRALYAAGPMQEEEFDKIRPLVACGLSWGQISRDYSYRSPSALSAQYRRFAERQGKGLRRSAAAEFK